MLRGVILWRDGDDLKGHGEFIEPNLDDIKAEAQRLTYNPNVDINWDRAVLGIRNRAHNLTYFYAWFKRHWVIVQRHDVRHVLHQDMTWDQLLDPVTAQPV